MTIYLASRMKQVDFAATEVSEALQIEPHFLSVVLRKLGEAGLLVSGDSPDSLRFARPETEITLKDVIVALDGWNIFTSCILGLPGCGERDPCPLHDRWAIERERLALMFQSSSLEDVARASNASGLRLTFD